MDAHRRPGRREVEEARQLLAEAEELERRLET
jgi:hypothetical protein